MSSSHNFIRTFLKPHENQSILFNYSRGKASFMGASQIESKYIICSNPTWFKKKKKNVEFRPPEWVTKGKESSCKAGDLGSIPGLRRSPGGGHGNPLQYSCQENPHEQRSLVGYSPWGHTSDTTEQLSTYTQGMWPQILRKVGFKNQYISSHFLIFFLTETE